jgi:hypothetical protein
MKKEHIWMMTLALVMVTAADAQDVTDPRLDALIKKAETATDKCASDKVTTVCILPPDGVIKKNRTGFRLPKPITLDRAPTAADLELKPQPKTTKAEKPSTSTGEKPPPPTGVQFREVGPHGTAMCDGSPTEQECTADGRTRGCDYRPPETTTKVYCWVSQGVKRRCAWIRQLNPACWDCGCE